MIQTTEVWVIVCDKCHQSYGRNYSSKYQMIQDANRLGGWLIKDPHAICKSCLDKEKI
jgi:hypothetical protein